MQNSQKKLPTAKDDNSSDKFCEEPPFKYYGHTQLKYCEALFTCLSSKVIHIKTATEETLNFQDYIMAETFLEILLKSVKSRDGPAKDE